MILYIILGGVVLSAVIVLGVLFFMLSKEGQKKADEENAVPLTDLDQLKKELSSGMFEPQQAKASKLESQIIPPFEPKASIPAPDTRSMLEDHKDSEYKERADQLEEQLQSIDKKAEAQSQEAKDMIEVLTKENEALKNQQADLIQAKQKLLELQTETSNLQTQNADLQTQLDSASAKVSLLEEQMAALRMQMGDEIRRADEAVTELNQQKEASLSAPKPEADPALLAELEALKSEQIQLKQKCEELEKDQYNLRVINSQLIEKNEALQYELIKARAQSSGLERVSYNYKNQLEDFFKKVNAAETSNEHLSQVKNRLEGMLEEVKGQNEELVKKDQLVQFELEKNRSRLVSLERECEDLKARMQKDPQA